MVFLGLVIDYDPASARMANPLGRAMIDGDGSRSITSPRKTITIHNQIGAIFATLVTGSSGSSCGDVRILLSSS
jgi:hypothetical protein